MVFCFWPRLAAKIAALWGVNMQKRNVIWWSAKPFTALVGSAVLAIALSLSVLPGHAQQGPFAELSGSWIGGGNITLQNGSHEPIRCRASYDTQSSGNDLKLSLRCASDSYNVDFQGNARNNGGSLSGSWFEATNHVAGQFTGSVKGNRIDARIEGQSFAAFLDVSTHGNRQSVSLRSPGSRVINVSIALKRK
jgi:hypothetical protein